MACLWNVYVLRDELARVRYVGVTRGPVAKRLAKHLIEARSANTHRGAWVRSMVARGLSPIIECVEQVEDWAEAETRWITKLRAEGAHLVNGNDGGHTMHQARERAGDHPALKRAYRNLESNARYFSRIGDSIRHYKMVLIKELLLRTAKACRREGGDHLDRLEAALSASALGSH